jgi:hypothetical protein
MTTKSVKGIIQKSMMRIQQEMETRKYLGNFFIKKYQDHGKKIKK